MLLFEFQLCSPAVEEPFCSEVFLIDRPQIFSDLTKRKNSSASAQIAETKGLFGNIVFTKWPQNFHIFSLFFLSEWCIVYI